MNRYLLSTLVLFLIIPQISQAGSWITKTKNSIYGTRNYKIYIPENITSNKAPALIVMLHGCEQNSDDFAKGSRITDWADKEKFIVLLPEQNSSFNPYRCWNWILPVNNYRTGEPAAIIEMVDEVTNDYQISKDKLFAAGMSAGASMVNILGNCYPDKFKAIQSHDGAQYYASAIAIDFISVVQNGASVPTETAAQLGHNCSRNGGNKVKQLPIIIFHGLNGPKMSPIHAEQIEAQMQAFNDYLDNGLRDFSFVAKEETTIVPPSSVYGYQLYKTINHKNEVVIERYMIEELAHNWSGGRGGYIYNDPKGPNATKLMIQFFKRFGL